MQDSGLGCWTVEAVKGRTVPQHGALASRVEAGRRVSGAVQCPWALVWHRCELDDQGTGGALFRVAVLVSVPERPGRGPDLAADQLSTAPLLPRHTWRIQPGSSWTEGGLAADTSGWNPDSRGQAADGLREDSALSLCFTMTYCTDGGSVICIKVFTWNCLNPAGRRRKLLRIQKFKKRLGRSRALCTLAGQFLWSFARSSIFRPVGA